MSRRAFVIVLDACAVGALPDAAGYGPDTNTRAHLAREADGLESSGLQRLRLGCVVELEGVGGSVLARLAGGARSALPGDPFV